MIYFCADDYGISKACNARLEQCLKDGALNKISVLPNGELSDFKTRLIGDHTTLSLHINLVEGHALSDQKNTVLVSEDGCFRHSFKGLFLLSFSRKRKELEKQLYQEIRAQLAFWKATVGNGEPLSIDSHQHTHMIPLVFKTLMWAIKDEEANVKFIRIPAEPLLPFLLTPSLYMAYKPTGIVKQWLLNVLGLFNYKTLEQSGMEWAYFMGVMFSGRMTEDKINKLLPHYKRLAQKRGKDIAIAFHPGYLEEGEHLMDGVRTSFETFYFSEWRKKEYETPINMEKETKRTERRNENVIS